MQSDYFFLFNLYILDKKKNIFVSYLANLTKIGFCV